MEGPPGEPGSSAYSRTPFSAVQKMLLKRTFRTAPGFVSSLRRRTVTAMGSPFPQNTSGWNRRVSMARFWKLTFSMFPPSRSWREMPRLERLMTQFSITMLRKSSSLSLPNLMAALVEVRVQLVTVMFSQGPYCMAWAVFLKTMQSSAHSMWQLAMRTFWQWSGSMPSQLAIRRSFRMRMPSMSTSRQPTMWTVQKALAASVTSRMVSRETFSRNSRGARG